MKLIIMTKPTFFVEEDKILTALFEMGLDHLHLYKPGTEPVYSERLLTLIPDEYYGRITVHDHFYLRDEFRLRGIHLDDCQTEPPIGYRGNISRTCHSIEELKDVRKRCNYVLLKLPMNELMEASSRGLVDKRVYAMGCINFDNIGLVRSMGFGGVVVGGDLWNRFDILGSLDYKELISHFEKLRKAVS